MFVHYRRAAEAVVSAAVCLTLAACSGSDSSPAPSYSASIGSSPAVVAPTISPTRPQHQIPDEKSIVEVPALRRTITLTSCKAVTGGWSAGGSAKNTTAKAQTYSMLVFFTDKYSRTIDFARGSVRVAPGKTGTWTATKTFSPPAGTQCVLRGLYAT